MSNQDYEVGYGRPPKQHRFVKGRSGNPSGRPRKAPSIADLVAKELATRVEITEPNGRRRRHRKDHLLIRQLLNKALKGEAQAQRLAFDVIGHAEAFRRDRGDDAISTKDQASADRAIFNALEQMFQLPVAEDEA